MSCLRTIGAAVAAAALLVPPGRPAAAAERAQATLAHIKLTGDLDEKPVAKDPILELGGENFKSKLDRIQKARKDDKVHGLLLEIDGLAVGWGKVDELRKAVADFRASGKKAYAYLESASSPKDYVVALACDQVAIPESGWLMLTGVQLGITFYKDLFEKIGVKADMLQMGEFKGAAEPYTRTRMSPQLRKNLESILDDYYEKSLVETVARSRPAKGWTVEQVKKLIDEGPYTAKAALEAGLVDRLAYPHEYADTLKEDLKAERVRVSRNYGQEKVEEMNFATIMKIYANLLSPPKKTSSDKPKVAVIYAVGPIMTGKGGESLFGGSVVGSTTMVQAIRQAEQDKTVKCIVLRVDSPGGSALASDLIWNELTRSKKPVVASMGDVAASGGYYISMAARKIYAEPGTLTGSIGVVGGKLVLGGLENKIGLNTEIISRGANAGLLSPYSAFSPSERKVFTALMKDIYDQFLDKALQGRQKAGKQLDRSALEKLAGGRIYTGRQAKDNGLIDEVGSLADAVAAAKELAGVDKETELEWLNLPKPKSFLEVLAESKAESELAAPALRRLLLRELPELGGKLRGLDGLLRLRGEPVWLIAPHHVEVR